MLKNFAAALVALLLSAAASAAVEVNKATQAELEAISGVGPVISAAIVNERKKSEFKDWNDLFNRIRGVGDRSAAKFSQGGMTVAGKPYPGPPYVEPAKTSAVGKAASSVKAGVKVVKDNVKEEKDAAKASIASAKATAAEKKAAKARPGAAAASAAKK